MKYCVVEIVKTENVTISYDLDMPFAYGGDGESVKVMRMWYPEEARYIKLFNTIKKAEAFIVEKSLGTGFKAVPHADVLVSLAEMKLRKI
jgi:hypothetical protein